MDEINEELDKIRIRHFRLLSFFLLVFLGLFVFLVISLELWQPVDLVTYKFSPAVFLIEIIEKTVLMIVSGWICVENGRKYKKTKNPIHINIEIIYFFFFLHYFFLQVFIFSLFFDSLVSVFWIFSIEITQLFAILYAILLFSEAELQPPPRRIQLLIAILLLIFTLGYSLKFLFWSLFLTVMGGYPFYRILQRIWKKPKNSEETGFPLYYQSLSILFFLAIILEEIISDFNLQFMLVFSIPNAILLVSAHLGNRIKYKILLNQISNTERDKLEKFIFF